MEILEQFKEIEDDYAWNAVFQQMSLSTSRYYQTYSLNVARSIENKSRNRYRDVLPYDHSRVCLTSGNCNYINASLVELPEAEKRYILCQGPLPNTCEHFWRMVWEQQSDTIVMLNRLIEKNSVKCHKYWPDFLQTLLYPDFSVHNDSEVTNAVYTVRSITLKNLSTEEERLVRQFHYEYWPDFGVPESPRTFIDFLLYVRKHALSTGPPIVHCSAGIGRSGTYVIVDSILALLALGPGRTQVSVIDTIAEVRKHRAGLVQTSEQLRFCYLAILDGIKLLMPHLLGHSRLESTQDGVSEEEEEEAADNNLSSLSASMSPRERLYAGSSVTGSVAYINTLREISCTVSEDGSLEPSPEPTKSSLLPSELANLESSSATCAHSGADSLSPDWVNIHNNFLLTGRETNGSSGNLSVECPADAMDNGLPSSGDMIAVEEEVPAASAHSVPPVRCIKERTVEFLGTEHVNLLQTGPSTGDTVLLELGSETSSLLDDTSRDSMRSENWGSAPVPPLFPAEGDVASSWVRLDTGSSCEDCPTASRSVSEDASPHLAPERCESTTLTVHDGTVVRESCWAPVQDLRCRTKEAAARSLSGGGDPSVDCSSSQTHGQQPAQTVSVSRLLACAVTAMTLTAWCLYHKSP